MKKVLLALPLTVIAVSNAQAAGKKRDFSTLGVSIKYSYSKPDGGGPLNIKTLILKQTAFIDTGLWIFTGIYRLFQPFQNS